MAATPYRELATRKMEKWARQGVKERPWGSNWGGFVSFINRGFGRAPWCQATIYTAFKAVGHPIIRTNTVLIFYRWARARGYTISKWNVQRGDQVIFEWDGRGGLAWPDNADHVATVRHRLVRSRIRVVEGNSSDRMRDDRVFSLSDRRIIAAVRIPGSKVDPRDPGPPYVTKPFPLPRMFKRARRKPGDRWIVNLGRPWIFSGNWRDAKAFLREKLRYWKRRNRRRR